MAANRPGIAAEQARLLARHSASAIVGNLAGSLVVVVLLWAVDDKRLLLAWLASIWATMALRGRLLKRYRREDPAAPEVIAWGRRFARNALVAAAVWGLAGFAFLHPFDEAYRRFGLSMALAGVAAGGAGTIAAWPLAGVAYVVLALAPLALRFFTIGDFDYAVMGVMVLIYMGVMLQVARRNHQSVMETLALRIESLQAQRGLSESELRFRALTEASTSAIFIIQHNRYVYANPAALAMTGYSFEELRDRDFWEILHPDFQALARSRGQARLEGLELPGRSEFKVITKSGQVKWVDFTAGTFTLEGQPAIVGIGNDATERKAVEDALRLARDEAESATRAKSMFLANMSHEIRTPMNGILGMTQLLELSQLSAEQREHLAVIRSSGDALLVLINDILDFSKIEAGKLGLEESDFELRSELERSLALYRPLARSKGLRLETLLAADLPERVRGDRTRLGQIVSNLVANAIKFTHAGVIRVEAHAQIVGDSGVRLEVSISDTGVGIPEDRVGKLFRPFEQADASTTRQYGGTGLGLAICSRLCEAMSGGIEVESRVGRGSVFRFHVMLGRAGTLRAALASQPQPSGDDLASLKVLVVDDNVTNRQLALAFLAKLGIRADVAMDGLEAVDRVRAGGYEVILMDMQMPLMDGIDATREIRRLDLPVRPYVIAFTANAFDADRERCLEAGMDDFLSKPFGFGELRDKLDAARRRG